MVTNLWVVIPAAAVPPARSFATRLLLAAAWAGHHSPTALRLHAIIGVILGVCACFLAGHALFSHRAGYVALSLTALVAVLGAALAGLDFILTGGNAASMTMSCAFVAALVSTGLQWHLVSRAITQSTVDSTLPVAR